MEELFKYIAEFGVAVVGCVAMFIVHVKYVNKKDEEAEKIREETVSLNKERENKLIDQIKDITAQLTNISAALNTCNKVSEELSATNKILVGKLNDNIAEFKEMQKEQSDDIKDIKDDINKIKTAAVNRLNGG